MEEGNPRAYRGCMITVFVGLISVIGLALMQTFGIIGFFLPWLLIGLAYWIIQGLITELAYGDEEITPDHTRQPK